MESITHKSKKIINLLNERERERDKESERAKKKKDFNIFVSL